MIEALTEWFRNITFLQIIDFVGTFAFAISGIRLASAKRFDWFGAYVVGAATAIGGGTLRDVMLDVPMKSMMSMKVILAAQLIISFIVSIQLFSSQSILLLVLKSILL